MPDLEPQWQRLLDAKLQLDMAWSYLCEVRDDLRTGTVPMPDREYAYKRALDGEQVAVAAYIKALNCFKVAALREDQAHRATGGTAD